MENSQLCPWGPWRAKVALLFTALWQCIPGFPRSSFLEALKATVGFWLHWPLGSLAFLRMEASGVGLVLLCPAETRL